MSTKKFLFSLASIVLFFSCATAPSFDVEKEQLKIQKTVFNETDFNTRIDIFYTDQTKKDSIKKLLENKTPFFETFVNEQKNDKTESTIKINKYSSTITIQDRLFRLVNATESFTILKKDLKVAYEDFENFLESNLFTFKVDQTSYKVTGNTNFIAIQHNNTWEYFNFNISIFYDAYGLKNTKKLAQLYDSEIFEPAAERWDAETVQFVKKLYSENKDLPQHKNRDFDAYCDCLIKHEEKVDPEKVAHNNYYNSSTHNNILYICRFLTIREE